eukprot:180692_1
MGHREKSSHCTSQMPSQYNVVSKHDSNPRQTILHTSPTLQCILTDFAEPFPVKFAFKSVPLLVMFASQHDRHPEHKIVDVLVMLASTQESSAVQYTIFELTIMESPHARRASQNTLPLLE